MIAEDYVNICRDVDFFVFIVMWLSESNRIKHLVYGCIAAVIFTVLFTFGLAIGMEFKDKQYGNKFDWLDVTATMIGGFIGQVIQGLLIWLII